ncbi:MAG: MFS transporter [Candidatus Thorarchaeota archaeon]
MDGNGGPVEEINHPTQDDDFSDYSWTQAVKKLTSNRNWTVFLATVWIYSSMVVMYEYFTLYFRDIGISYILTGTLFSIMFTINIAGNFISGYLVDNYDRRNLSVITMIIPGIFFLIISLTTEVVFIALAMLIGGIGSLSTGSGEAYQMQQVDREFSGVAQSMFRLGTSLGLIPLYLFALMLDLGMSFITVMQIILFVAGILNLICAVIRVTGLEQLPLPKRKIQSDRLLKDFISENIRGLRLLLRVFPIFIVIICIDALSDSLYSFAKNYYVNETLGFGYVEINLMILITLAFSVPLALVVGRVFDKRGGQGLTLAVYSLMPISIYLLIVSQNVRYIAPIDWILALDSIYPGLSVICSLAFIATAMKAVNDILWATILASYIQRSLPRSDFGKMLSLSSVLVSVFVALGPIPAGIIYTNWQGLPLLVIIMIINFVILIILAVKSLEPQMSVEDLEAEGLM